MEDNHFRAPRSTVGDGLIIRTYRDEDARALCEATVSSFAHLSPFMPWANSTQTVEQTRSIIEGFESGFVESTDFVLGIWRQVDDAFIGGTGFHLREGPLDYGSAEIGMWIAAEYAGQGLGKRALGVLLRWGFTTWPWQRLAWRCNAENIASIRCAKANGFFQEGLLRGQYNPIDGSRRDTACFSILRHEWADRRAV